MDHEGRGGAARRRADDQVMAAVDEGEDTLFVISDVSSDGRWVTIEHDQAAKLAEWQ